MFTHAQVDLVCWHVRRGGMLSGRLHLLLCGKLAEIVLLPIAVPPCVMINSPCVFQTVWLSFFSFLQSRFNWYKLFHVFFLLFFTQAETPHMLWFIFLMIHSRTVCPGPVQETVRGAGFEPGTAASSVWCHPVALANWATTSPHV
jgi:hypothetical protein